MTKSATNLHQHNHPLFSFRAPFVVAWSGESLCWQTHEPHVECVGCELSIGSLTSRLPEGRRLQLITITVIIFNARPDARAGGGPTHPTGTYGTWLVGVRRTFGGQRGDSSGDETPSADCLSLTLHYVRPTLRGDTDACYWVKVNPNGTACYFLFDLRYTHTLWNQQIFKRSAQQIKVMPAILKELRFYCNLYINSNFKRFSRSTVKRKVLLK